MDDKDQLEQRFVDPHSVLRSIGIREGMVVADIGAGSGAYVFELAKMVGESGKVYAVEVRQDMLTRIASGVRERDLDNVETIWGDVDRREGTRLPDGTLDLVLFSNILFQLEFPEDSMKEVNRILKSGGKLAVVEWSDSFNHMGPPQADVVDIKKAKQLADAAGFALVKEFEPGSHHYGLVLKKQ